MLFRNLRRFNIKFFSQVQTQSSNQQVEKVYKEGQMVNNNLLTLKKSEDIENYVMKIIKEYFRTTKKASIQVESNLSDHGLDSLDSIELAMKLEEDLGYVISAETLPVFHKPKHFINYISQVEKFKSDHKKNPLA